MLKCRTCLALCEENGTLNIFTKMASSPELDMLIVNILTEVTNVQATPNDMYPHNICTVCYNNLCNAQAFILKAQESDNLMRNGIIGNEETLNLNENVDVSSFGTTGDISKNTPIIVSTESLNKNNIDKRSSDIRKSITMEFLEEEPKCVSLINGYSNSETFLEEPAENSIENMDDTESEIKTELLQEHEIKQELESEQDHDMDADFADRNYFQIETSIHDEISSTYIKVEPLSEDDALKIHSQANSEVVPIEVDIPQSDLPNGHSLSESEEDQKPTEEELVASNQAYSVSLSNIREPPPKASFFNHKCEVCSQYFTSKYAMWEHEAEHKKVIQTPNEICMLCGKGFKSRRSLKTHVITSHSYGKISKCSLCEETFSSVDSLSAHVLNHPVIKTGNPCSVCEKAKFRSENHLKMHILKCHREAFVMRHSCDICERSFQNRAALLSHVRHCCSESILRKRLDQNRESASPVLDNLGLLSPTSADLAETPIIETDLAPGPLIATDLGAFCLTAAELAPGPFILADSVAAPLIAADPAPVLLATTDLTPVPLATADLTAVPPALNNLAPAPPAPINQASHPVSQEAQTESPVPETSPLINPAPFQKPAVAKEVSQKLGAAAKKPEQPNEKAMQSLTPLLCPKCPKKFLYEFARKQHVENQHNKKFACHVCRCRFKRNDHLLRHVRALHPVLTDMPSTEPLTD